MSDQLDALRLADARTDPSPAFAEALRDRLVARILEADMPVITRSRNGSKQGDIAYVTLGVPDLDKAKAFYGTVLGWQFEPGHVPDGAQVLDCVPMLGLWGGSEVPGAVLSYRVDDLEAAVARVRASGGTCTDPRREAYGTTADGVDPDGIPFWLHGEMPAADPVPENGARQGDVSYVSLVVPARDRALAFYRAVTDGASAAPTIGLSETGKVAMPTGAVLCYRVDDMAAAAARVEAAGGTVRSIDQRPYAVELLGVDDQGLDFYLHQF